jgi:recombination protein RecA
MRTDAAAVSPSLASALETLRSRGLDLRRGTQPAQSAQPRPSVSSGHAGLDVALATGGWPRGALALLDAPAGGGATTLALDGIAAAQAGGGLAAWLDVEGTFDPAVAARLGVQLDWLLLAHPTDAPEAVELAAWLGRSGLLDVVVLDLGERSHTSVDRRALDRLGALLARAGTTSVLAVAPTARATVGTVAGVRVALRRAAWLALGRDLVGQRVHATVERHRWALAGGSAELDLWFVEGRRTDALAARLAQPRPAELATRPALRVVRSA